MVNKEKLLKAIKTAQSKMNKQSATSILDAVLVDGKVSIKRLGECLSYLSYLEQEVSTVYEHVTRGTTSDARCTADQIIKLHGEAKKDNFMFDVECEGEVAIYGAGGDWEEFQEKLRSKGVIALTEEESDGLRSLFLQHPNERDEEGLAIDDDGEDEE